MDLSLRKAKANAVLSWRFAWRVLIGHLVFWRRRKGADLFLQRYAADGTAAVSVDERSLFPSLQKCQVCSLCTFSCDAIRQGNAPSAFEPKTMLVAFGRSPSESELFLDDWLPCYECGACTVECPNGVPVHAMAEKLVARRKRIGFRRTLT